MIKQKHLITSRTTRTTNNNNNKNKHMYCFIRGMSHDNQQLVRLATSYMNRKMLELTIITGNADDFAPVL